MKTMLARGLCIGVIVVCCALVAMPSESKQEKSSGRGAGLIDDFFQQLHNGAAEYAFRKGLEAHEMAFLQQVLVNVTGAGTSRDQDAFYDKLSKWLAADAAAADMTPRLVSLTIVFCAHYEHAERVGVSDAHVDRVERYGRNVFQAAIRCRTSAAVPTATVLATVMLDGSGRADGNASALKVEKRYKFADGKWLLTGSELRAIE